MAYELILEKLVTERGIVVRIPVDGRFQVKKLGENGEIPGLLCPMCKKEHLVPGKLQKHKDPSMTEEVIMLNSIFCRVHLEYFDVHNEMIFMTIDDARQSNLY
ncbi:MAG: hypothetical protein LBI27_07315 [Clostridiales bacterium]|nr:hypothetical protein [Clostridiales bacterium]